MGLVKYNSVELKTTFENKKKYVYKKTYQLRNLMNFTVKFIHNFFNLPDILLFVKMFPYIYKRELLNWRLLEHRMVT